MSVTTFDLPVLILVGPTAIGKTELSLELARHFNCEIISVDSMQVYRYMDIGTAKVTNKERGGIAHHLINIVDPDESYDAARFTKDALTAIVKIHAKGKIPLLTGGTGLYLRALISGIFQGPPVDRTLRQQLKHRLQTEGSDVLHDELSLYDCISADKIHKNDSQRLLRALEIYHSSGKTWSEYLDSKESGKHQVKFTNMLQIGLACDRSVLYDRINLRTEIMLESGFEDEVRGLLDRGYSRDLKSMGSIGYRHMINYIFGDWQFEEMKRLLARDTRRYAKRQLTWFGRIDDLNWIEVENMSKIIKTTENKLDLSSLI